MEQRLRKQRLKRGSQRWKPDGHGLTVLPFFSGERSTGWADYARAAVIGMSLSTEPIDILRASLEAVAYRFAAIYDLLAEAMPRANAHRRLRRRAAALACLDANDGRCDRRAGWWLPPRLKPRAEARRCWRCKRSAIFQISTQYQPRSVKFMHLTPSATNVINVGASGSNVCMIS